MLVSLTLVALAFAALNLSDRSEALSLPTGSVRAVIALSLILIFAITSTFLYSQLAQGSTANPESARFAEQILTTVSTLVVAVAGFYFGTRAVQSAQEEVEQPRLHILSPDSPAVELPKDQGKELIIKVEATPRSEAVAWDAPKPDDGALMQVSPGEFKYTRGPNAADEVTLRFRLVDYPDVGAKLTVKAPTAPVTPATSATPATPAAPTTSAASAPE